MLSDPRCAGCNPSPAVDPVTGAVMRDMLDIPDFLRRDLHPEYNAARAGGTGSHSTIHHDDTELGINRRRAYETDEDRRLRALMLRNEVTAKKEDQKVKSTARREETKAKKAGEYERKMNQRKTFRKHFKWGIDGL